MMDIQKTIGTPFKQASKAEIPEALVSFSLYNSDGIGTWKEI